MGSFDAYIANCWNEKWRQWKFLPFLGKKVNNYLIFTPIAQENNMVPYRQGEK